MKHQTVQFLALGVIVGMLSAIMLMAIASAPTHASKPLQPEVQVSNAVYRVRDPETGVTCYMSAWHGTSCLVTPADQMAASKQSLDNFLK